MVFLKKVYIQFIALILFLCVSAYASQASPEKNGFFFFKDDVQDTYQKDLKDFIVDFPGICGCEILSEDKSVFFSFESSKLFIPASLNKLITAFSALETFGPEYRYPTKISSDSKPTPVFGGNIYIKGFGNPVLNPQKYKDVLSYIVKTYAIKELNGDIVIDFSYFDQSQYYGKGWMWDDPQPQISALNLWLENYSIFMNKPYSLIEDMIGYYTLASLKDFGVVFNGKIKNGKMPENKTLLYTHQSEELFDVVKIMLEKSDNYIAEHIFRSIGANIYGLGSTENSVKVYENLLFSKLGLLKKNYIIADGSGLSMYNLLSPQLLNSLNYFMYTKYKEKYLDILATPGEKSTIENRFKFSTLWAKTGTLYSDSGISGIIKTKKNNLYFFTLMENNYTSSNLEIKEFETKFLTLLYENY